jgi:Tetratricopeptide repeat
LNRPGGGIGGPGSGGGNRPGEGGLRPGGGNNIITGGGNNTINRPNLDLGNRQISNQFNTVHWNHYNQHWAAAYRPAWVRPANWYRPWYGGRPMWYWGQPWYWYHWRWHQGYWVYSNLASFWLGATSSALLSPEVSYVYSNPYYALPIDVTVPLTLNYSDPIPRPGGDLAALAYPPAPSADENGEGQELPTSEPPAPPTDDPAVSAANEQFDAARKAFKDGQYAQAQKLVEKAIEFLPSDATLHEFRALTLFAQKKYKDAAATLYAVLSAGPGWDRRTLRGLYPDWDTYQAQLNDLASYLKNHPDDGSAHFLMAYHYLVNSDSDQAAAQLKEVVRLVPKDQLSAKLLQALTSQ